MGYYYSSASILSITGLVILTVALYILFTGSGEQFNVGAFLEETSPYVWAMTGVGLNIGMSVIG
jgi:V-type H+-transporting ATPase proteolipid subunit